MQVSQISARGRRGAKTKLRADFGLIVMPVVKRQEVNTLSEFPLYQMLVDTKLLELNSTGDIML